MAGVSQNWHYTRLERIFFSRDSWRSPPAALASARLCNTSHTYTHTMCEASERICRICRGGETDECNDEDGCAKRFEPLLSPCNCKGSCALVHGPCILAWIASQASLSTSSSPSTLSIICLTLRVLQARAARCVTRATSSSGDPSPSAHGEVQHSAKMIAGSCACPLSPASSPSPTWSSARLPSLIEPVRARDHFTLDLNRRCSNSIHLRFTYIARPLAHHPHHELDVLHRSEFVLLVVIDPKMEATEPRAIDIAPFSQ